MNKAREALTRAVNRAIANGAPVVTEVTPTFAWGELDDAIANTNARNVRVGRLFSSGDLALFGNDGTVLTFDPKIAQGYIASDWDAINCRATR